LPGSEFDDKHLAELEGIPGFQKLHTGKLCEVGRRFDFIVLVHTLKHIEAPVAFLRDVKELLAPGGTLFIQVPHYPETPFELMTADHASHFDAASLSSLLAKAGFCLRIISTEWVAKELSAVAGDQKGADGKTRISHSDVRISNPLVWLDELLPKAASIQSRSHQFAIFGSSIAATWTAANLPHLPDFFVDEDPPAPEELIWTARLCVLRRWLPARMLFVALQESVAAAVEKCHSGASPGHWHR